MHVLVSIVIEVNAVIAFLQGFGVALDYKAFLEEHSLYKMHEGMVLWPCDFFHYDIKVIS